MASVGIKLALRNPPKNAHDHGVPGSQDNFAGLLAGIKIWVHTSCGVYFGRKLDPTPHWNKRFIGCRPSDEQAQTRPSSTIPPALNCQRAVPEGGGESRNARKVPFCARAGYYDSGPAFPVNSSRETKHQSNEPTIPSTLSASDYLPPKHPSSDSN